MVYSTILDPGEKYVQGTREICTVSGPIHINEVKIKDVAWGNGNTAYEIPFHFDIDFGSVTSKASLVWEGQNVSTAFYIVEVTTHTCVYRISRRLHLVVFTLLTSLRPSGINVERKKNATEKDHSR
jgi:hypothetical protein